MNADIRRPFACTNPLARVWQPRGLDWLLLPCDVAELTPKSEAPTAAPAGNKQRWQAPQGQGAQQGNRRNATQPAYQRQSPPQDRVATAHPAPATRVTREPREPAFQMPDVWAKRLGATRPGLIVWTYASLGGDLLGVQSAGLDQRRTFLGTLLRDLNHPAGTHTFWPVMLPADNDAAFAPNPQAFWAGMARLGARAVVAMGDTAVQALGLPTPLEFMQQTRHNGALVLSVWDVADLLGNKGRYSSMLTYVRTFLRPLLSRMYA